MLSGHNPVKARTAVTTAYEPTQQANLGKAQTDAFLSEAREKLGRRPRGCFADQSPWEALGRARILELRPAAFFSLEARIARFLTLHHHLRRLA